MKSALILIMMTVSLFGFAGGGGSSSGGGGGSSSYSSDSSYSSSSDSDGDPLAIIFTLIMMAILTFIVVMDDKRKNKKKSEEKAEQVGVLGKIDHNDTEQEKWIHQEAEKIFRKYQEDWSNYDLKNIQKYTTASYYQHACLMLEAIDKTGRRNVVSELSISRVHLFTPVDDNCIFPSKVQVMFRFSGIDGIVDMKSGCAIRSDKVQGVNEYWNFVFDGLTLKLDGITQSTESTPHLIESIARFAKENQLFYSSDWGRLALPTEGLIFDERGLSSADVNNHVVGKWKDCLVQMYTYSATPADPTSYFLVGQISVPGSYEGVIVEAKKSKLKIKGLKNYESFEMEWSDFNKRYKVYAASRDALPAFELLNPVFMDRLYKRNLFYNLEVRGNTIYVFAKVEQAKEENYAELLNTLAEAFNELKM